MVAAVVDELLLRGQVKSKAEAFRWLEDRGWLSATALRDSYYQARRQERFKAALVQNPDRARLITESEFNQAVSGAVMLDSVKTITHTLAEFPEGTLILTFEGL